MNSSSLLNIMTYNCNSIVASVSRIEELKLFLRRYDVCVSLLNETFLKPNVSFDIPGYNVIRTDSDGRGAGTAILVRSDVKYREVRVPHLTSFKDVTGIQVFSNTSTVTVFSVYVPNAVNNILPSCIGKLLCMDERVILGGDFNARHVSWGCYNSNTRGNNLHRYLQSHSGVRFLVPESPTYYPNGGYNFSRADWSDFRDQLDCNMINLTHEFNSTEMIDEGVVQFERAINSAVHSAVPKIRVQYHDLPNDIKQMIRVKNQIRRTVQKPRFNTAENRRILNDMQRQVNIAVADHRNTTTRNELSHLRPHDNNMFNHIKRLTRVRDYIPPLKTDAGSFVYTSSDKANCLAEHFSRVHDQNNELGNSSHTETVCDKVTTFLNDAENAQDVPTVHPNEVKQVVRALKNRKAPGFDCIRNVVIKNLSLNAIAYLTSLINAMFVIGYFPTCWKTAKIVAFSKPGKPKNDPASFRPISLLPCLGKITEKLLAKDITAFATQNNVLPDVQFGFRQNHSTTHALLNTLSGIRTNIMNKRTEVMVSLDIEKAFDTVWLSGLMYKTIELGFPVYVIRMLHSYLTNRNFNVVIGESKSETKALVNGLPEGSVLGPILFTIFISDIPRLDYTNLSMFADDTSIRSSSLYPTVAIARVQAHLNALYDYFNLWKIKVNPNKTEFIIMTRKRTDLSNLQLHYGQNQIEKVKEMKVLGVWIDEKINFRTHVSKTITKAKDAMRRLHPLMNRNSGLILENRIAIYKIFVRSILTYGITIWNASSVANLKRIQVFQNKYLRPALGLRPDPITYRQVNTTRLHEMANIELIVEFATRLTYLFYMKMINHPNQLISGMTDFDRSDTHHPLSIIRELV